MGASLGGIKPFRHSDAAIIAGLSQLSAFCLSDKWLIVSGLTNYVMSIILPSRFPENKRIFFIGLEKTIS